MYSLAYLFLCMVFLASFKIYAANLFTGEIVDLGSYKTSVAISKGPAPRRYEPLTKFDKKAILNAQILINNLRSNFSTGVPPLPALDPYIGRNFPAINLNNRNLPFSGKIIINKVRITGGKHLYLNDIEIRMNNLRTDFDLSIPQLNANVTFDADLQLGGILPISAKGKVRITIIGVNIRGTVWATETPKSTVNIYSIEGLRIGFHADNIKIRLLKTSLRKYELQTLSSSTSPASKNELTLLIGAIKNNIAREIVRQINNILKNLTAEQVKNYLLSK